MLKVFGIEHILCFIAFKIIAGILLVSILANRISIAILYSKPILIFPVSLCGLTSLIFSLLVLFGKPNMNAYQCFWFMAIGGGIITLIYPDFLASASSIFEVNIFTGLVHHYLCILLALQMVMFGWFRPNLRKIYYFPMMFCVYIVVGAFELHVLCEDEIVMNLTQPLLSGTILNVWFIWVMGSVVVTLIALVYELIAKKKKRKLVSREEVADVP